jgi:hypothetical protein
MQDQSSRGPEPVPSAVAEILTTREVAREMCCSRAHVHNIINDKVFGTPPLPAITIGRRRLMRRVSLDQWPQAIEDIVRFTAYLITQRGKAPSVTQQVELGHAAVTIATRKVEGLYL